jgi:2-polyprenyl-3-methyl-5-hydroxy-6-metoxy-1,4-benzoquinol methylase
MDEYNDYGYTTSNNTCAHAYLVGSVASLLNHAKNTNVLDAGCGNGWLASYLISKGFNVYGTDASVSGIKLAKEKHPGRFFLQDVTKDLLPEDLAHIKFDTIISTEVIEHLYNPRKYIQFCKTVLQASGGGEIILSTPYHGYLKNVVLSLSGKMDKHFTVMWDGGHIKFWSRKTLTSLLEEAGFKIIDFKGCGRVPYLWKSMIIKAKI